MCNILSQQKWKFFWNDYYAQYIADGTLQSVILACSCLHGSHTGFATLHAVTHNSTSFEHLQYNEIYF